MCDWDIHVARRADQNHLGAQSNATRTAAVRKHEVTMKKEYDFSKAKRGPALAASPGKTRITIRIDDDVINWFREQVRAAGGGNYQTLINDALRSYIDAVHEPLEDLLRRVLREELRVSKRAARKRSA